MNSIFRDHDKAPSIQGVYDSFGGVIVDQDGMDNILINSFKKLYTTNESVVWGNSFVPQNFRYIDSVKVLKAISTINPQKAIGTDLFHMGAFLKLREYNPSAYDILQKKLVQTLTSWFDKCKFPAYLKEARLVAIPKGKDIVVHPDDVRGISVLGHIHKIIEETLHDQMVEHKFFGTGTYQAGFKAGESCLTDQTRVINFIKNKMIDSKKATAMLLLVDTKKAFDSINRSKLYKFMDDYADKQADQTSLRTTLLRHWIECYKDLNDGHKVRLGKHEFVQNKGLPQGSKLSPEIFNFYLE